MFIFVIIAAIVMTVINSANAFPKLKVPSKKRIRPHTHMFPKIDNAITVL